MDMKAKALAFVGAVMLVLLAATLFTLAVYTIAAMPQHDLSPWQTVGVAWSIISVIISLFMVAGAVVLAIWGFVS